MRTRGSKQQCCWGWLFLVASSLPSIPPPSPQGEKGDQRGRGSEFISFMSCHSARGSWGWLACWVGMSRRNEEQMETNLQTNGRNGSHYRVDGGGESIVLL